MELGRDSDTGGQVFGGHNIFLVYGNKAKFIFFIPLLAFASMFHGFMNTLSGQICGRAFPSSCEDAWCL